MKRIIVINLTLGLSCRRSDRTVQPRGRSPRPMPPCAVRVLRGGRARVAGRGGLNLA